MRLLEGTLSRLFGRAFGAVYTDGTLHKADLTPTADGGATAVFTDHAIKAQLADWTAFHSGVPQTDIRLFVLRHCLAVTPTQDDEVTYDGRRYRITGPVKTDPAGTHWDLQARPYGR